MNKISLCITCWSKDVYMLPELLANVKQQTVQPDEIIVVGNDLKSITTEKNIITYAEPTRRSVSFSRNKAAELARGDILIYHDVDDTPHVQKIELIKKAFENDEVEAFVHGFLIGSIYPFKYSELKMVKIKGLQFPKPYLKAPRQDVSHGHLSIKKEILNDIKYDETITWGEDADFCKRLFLSGHNIYYGDHKLINYRPSYKDSNRQWYSV
jgi:glycosyltransferase involved in cell wall biosynthesis